MPRPRVRLPPRIFLSASLASTGMSPPPIRWPSGTPRRSSARARPSRRGLGRADLAEAHHREQTPGAQSALLDELQVLTDEDALDIEHRAPAQHVGERCHAAFDPAAHAFLGAEMIDDDHLAAGTADACKLAHDLL